MSPAPAGGEAWRPVAVRFYAGAKADQTPREVLWHGAWQPVRLLAEELTAPAGGGPPWRVFRLELATGGRIALRGRGDGWQAKSLTAFAAQC